VITSLELRRIWASLLVKIVLIIAGIWAILRVAWVAGVGYFNVTLTERASQDAAAVEQLRQRLAQELSSDLVLAGIDGQIVFVILLTLAWGSGAIATDVRDRALQFYFAKPVTERTYLLGKITPLAVYCFFICVVPGTLIALVEGSLLQGQGLAASRSALVLPAILYSLVLSVLLSVGSVGISSLSRNRLLTLAYWAGILFVPLAVAGIVDLATQGEFVWLYLASPLTMARLLGRAIFRLSVEGPVQWYHALLTLAAVCGGSLWLAWQRLSKTEVVG
jgi:hypothetical protein